jgi:hypothetical protein
MSSLIEPIISDHLLARLGKDEVLDPILTITDLYQEYSPGQAREKLREIKESILSEAGVYDSSSKRAELFFFFNLLEKALEGGYLLANGSQDPPIPSDDILCKDPYPI